MCARRQHVHISRESAEGMSSEQASMKEAVEVLDCREWLMEARNVLRSAVFVLCNRQLDMSKHRMLAPLLFRGCMMLLILLMLTCGAWTARIAVQKVTDFEASLASVQTLADQSWVFSSDLEERMNSMQRYACYPGILGHLMCPSWDVQQCITLTWRIAQPTQLPQASTCM